MTDLTKKYKSDVDTSVSEVLRRLPWAVAAAAIPNLALAGPEGGDVVEGAADISAPDANTTLIDQYSDRAVINWQTFNVDGDEFVIFSQPSASSAVLNRIVGGDPSVILGTIQANGQVFLINTRGILFGEGATLDVQGLVASTMDISDADFMDGDYVFVKDSAAPDASVVNQGQLTAAESGYIVLAGDYVENSGVIAATLGHVVLASGAHMTLDLQGDGLVSFAVDESTLAELAGVSNLGTIAADGSMVIMTADVASGLVATAVNQQGLIEAYSVGEHAGEVFLMAEGGDIVNSGAIVADGASGEAGGTVRLQGDGDARNYGTITAYGDSGADGGLIEVSGDGGITIGHIGLGAGGRLVIDPPTILIGDASSGSEIDAAVIETQLNSGVDVDVVASNQILGTSSVGGITASGSGDLFFGIGSLSSGGAYFAGTGGMISFDAPITIGGDFGAVAQGGGMVQLGSLDVGGNIMVDAGAVLIADLVENSFGSLGSYGSLTATGHPVTAGGDVSITATGGVSSEGFIGVGAINAGGNVNLSAMGTSFAGIFVVDDVFETWGPSGESFVSYGAAINAGGNVSLNANASSQAEIVVGDITTTGGNVFLAANAGGFAEIIVADRYSEAYGFAGSVNTFSESGTGATINATGNVTLFGSANEVEIIGGSISAGGNAVAIAEGFWEGNISLFTSANGFGSSAFSGGFENFMGAGAPVTAGGNILLRATGPGSGAEIVAGALSAGSNATLVLGGSGEMLIMDSLQETFSWGSVGSNDSYATDGAMITAGGNVGIFGSGAEYNVFGGISAGGNVSVNLGGFAAFGAAGFVDGGVPVVLDGDPITAGGDVSIHTSGSGSGYGSFDGLLVLGAVNAGGDVDLSATSSAAGAAIVVGDFLGLPSSVAASSHVGSQFALEDITAGGDVFLTANGGNNAIIAANNITAGSASADEARIVIQQSASSGSVYIGGNVSATGNGAGTGSIDQYGYENAAAGLFIDAAGNVFIGGDINVTGGAGQFTNSSSFGSYGHMSSGSRGLATVDISAWGDIDIGGSVNVAGAGIAQVILDASGGGISVGDVNVSATAVNFASSEFWAYGSADYGFDRIFGSGTISGTGSFASVGEGIVEIYADSGSVVAGNINVTGPSAYLDIEAWGGDVSMGSLSVTGSGQVFSESGSSNSTWVSGSNAWDSTGSYQVESSFGSAYADVYGWEGSVTVAGDADVTGAGEAYLGVRGSTVTVVGDVNIAANPATRSFTGRFDSVRTFGSGSGFSFSQNSNSETVTGGEAYGNFDAGGSGAGNGTLSLGNVSATGGSVGVYGFGEGGVTVGNVTADASGITFDRANNFVNSGGIYGSISYGSSIVRPAGHSASVVDGYHNQGGASSSGVGIAEGAGFGEGGYGGPAITVVGPASGINSGAIIEFHAGTDAISGGDVTFGSLSATGPDAAVSLAGRNVVGSTITVTATGNTVNGQQNFANSFFNSIGSGSNHSFQSVDASNVGTAAVGIAAYGDGSVAYGNVDIGTITADATLANSAAIYIVGEGDVSVDVLTATAGNGSLASAWSQGGFSASASWNDTWETTVDTYGHAEVDVGTWNSSGNDISLGSVTATGPDAAVDIDGWNVTVGAITVSATGYNFAEGRTGFNSYGGIVGSGTTAAFLSASSYVYGETGFEAYGEVDVRAYGSFGDSMAGDIDVTSIDVTAPYGEVSLTGQGGISVDTVNMTGIQSSFQETAEEHHVYGAAGSTFDFNSSSTWVGSQQSFNAYGGMGQSSDHVTIGSVTIAGAEIDFGVQAANVNLGTLSAVQTGFDYTYASDYVGSRNGGATSYAYEYSYSSIGGGDGDYYFAAPMTNGSSTSYGTVTVGTVDISGAGNAAVDLDGGRLSFGSVTISQAHQDYTLHSAYGWSSPSFRSDNSYNQASSWGARAFVDADGGDVNFGNVTLVSGSNELRVDGDTIAVAGVSMTGISMQPYHSDWSSNRAWGPAGSSSRSYHSDYSWNSVSYDYHRLEFDAYGTGGSSAAPTLSVGSITIDAVRRADVGIQLHGVGGYADIGAVSINVGSDYAYDSSYNSNSTDNSGLFAYGYHSDSQGFADGASASLYVDGVGSTNVFDIESINLVAPDRAWGRLNEANYIVGDVSIVATGADYRYASSWTRNSAWTTGSTLGSYSSSWDYSSFNTNAGSAELELRNAYDINLGSVSLTGTTRNRLFVSNAFGSVSIGPLSQTIQDGFDYSYSYTYNFSSTQTDGDFFNSSSDYTYASDGWGRNEVNIHQTDASASVNIGQVSILGGANNYVRMNVLGPLNVAGIDLQRGSGNTFTSSSAYGYFGSSGRISGSGTTATQVRSWSYASSSSWSYLTGGSNVVDIDGGGALDMGPFTMDGFADLQFNADLLGNVNISSVNITGGTDESYAYQEAWDFSSVSSSGATQSSIYGYQSNGVGDGDVRLYLTAAGSDRAVNVTGPVNIAAGDSITLHAWGQAGGPASVTLGDLNLSVTGAASSYSTASTRNSTSIMGAAYGSTYNYTWGGTNAAHVDVDIGRSTHQSADIVVGDINIDAAGWSADIDVWGGDISVGDITANVDGSNSGSTSRNTYVRTSSGGALVSSGSSGYSWESFADGEFYLEVRGNQGGGYVQTIGNLDVIAAGEVDIGIRGNQVTVGDANLTVTGNSGGYVTSFDNDIYGTTASELYQASSHGTWGNVDFAVYGEGSGGSVNVGNLDISARDEAWVDIRGDVAATVGDITVDAEGSDYFWNSSYSTDFGSSGRSNESFYQYVNNGGADVSVMAEGGGGGTVTVGNVSLTAGIDASFAAYGYDVNVGSISLTATDASYFSHGTWRDWDTGSNANSYNSAWTNSSLSLGDASVDLRADQFGDGTLTVGNITVIGNEDVDVDLRGENMSAGVIDLAALGSTYHWDYFYTSDYASGSSAYNSSYTSFNGELEFTAYGDTGGSGTVSIGDITVSGVEAAYGEIRGGNVILGDASFTANTESWDYTSSYSLTTSAGYASDYIYNDSSTGSGQAHLVVDANTTSGSVTIGNLTITGGSEAYGVLEGFDVTATAINVTATGETEHSDSTYSRVSSGGDTYNSSYTSDEVYGSAAAYVYGDRYNDGSVTVGSITVTGVGHAEVGLRGEHMSIGAVTATATPSFEAWTYHENSTTGTASTYGASSFSSQAYGAAEFWAYGDLGDDGLMNFGSITVQGVDAAYGDISGGNISIGVLTVDASGGTAAWGGGFVATSASGSSNSNGYSFDRIGDANFRVHADPFSGSSGSSVAGSSHLAGVSGHIEIGSASISGLDDADLAVYGDVVTIGQAVVTGGGAFSNSYGSGIRGVVGGGSYSSFAWSNTGTWGDASVDLRGSTSVTVSTLDIQGMGSVELDMNAPTLAVSDLTMLASGSSGSWSSFTNYFDSMGSPTWDRTANGVWGDAEVDVGMNASSTMDIGTMDLDGGPIFVDLAGGDITVGSVDMSASGVVQSSSRVWENRPFSASQSDWNDSSLSSLGTASFEATGAGIDIGTLSVSGTSALVNISGDTLAVGTVTATASGGSYLDSQSRFRTSNAGGATVNSSGFEEFSTLGSAVVNITGASGGTSVTAGSSHLGVGGSVGSVTASGVGFAGVSVTGDVLVNTVTVSQSGSASYYFSTGAIDNRTQVTAFVADEAAFTADGASIGSVSVTATGDAHLTGSFEVGTNITVAAAGSVDTMLPSYATDFGEGGIYNATIEFRGADSGLNLTAAGLLFSAGGSIDMGSAALTIGSGSAGVAGDALAGSLAGSPGLAPNAAFIGSHVTFGDVQLDGDYIKVQADGFSFASGASVNASSGDVIQILPFMSSQDFTVNGSYGGSVGVDYTLGSLGGFAGVQLLFGGADHTGDIDFGSNGAFGSSGLNVAFATQGSIGGSNLMANIVGFGGGATLAGATVTADTIGLGDITTGSASNLAAYGSIGFTETADLGSGITINVNGPTTVDGGPASQAGALNVLGAGTLTVDAGSTGTIVLGADADAIRIESGANVTVSNTLNSDAATLSFGSYGGPLGNVAVTFGGDGWVNNNFTGANLGLVAGGDLRMGGNSYTVDGLLSATAGSDVDLVGVNIVTGTLEVIAGGDIYDSSPSSVTAARFADALGSYGGAIAADAAAFIANGNVDLDDTVLTIGNGATAFTGDYDVIEVLDRSNIAPDSLDPSLAVVGGDGVSLGEVIMSGDYLFIQTDDLESLTDLTMPETSLLQLAPFSTLDDFGFEETLAALEVTNFGFDQHAGSFEGMTLVIGSGLEEGDGFLGTQGVIDIGDLNFMCATQGNCTGLQNILTTGLVLTLEGIVFFEEPTNDEVDPVTRNPNEQLDEDTDRDDEEDEDTEGTEGTGDDRDEPGSIRHKTSEDPGLVCE